MKIDCGFWDKNGQYKEDIQEIEMLSVKELNEIELIKAQNEGLKKQNAELQQEIQTLKEEHKKWLNIAKEGADASEYCLQELEKELKPFQDDYFKGLTKQQIAELAKKSIRLTTENREIVAKLNEFADKFDCINDYVDEVHIHYENETGECCGIEDAIWGFELVKLQELLRDFTNFVEEIK